MGDKGRNKGTDKADLEKVVVTQAIVLADTFERRFAPISLEMPRSLMPIANTPMLDYAIESLCSSGIQEIYVFAASHAKQIQQHIAASQWTRMPATKIQVIVSQACANAGEALREIYSKSVITSDFVLIYGDCITNMKLDAVLEIHRQRKLKDKKAIMTMVLKKAAPSHSSRSVEDETVLAINPASNELLHYDNSRRHKRIKLRSRTFLSLPEVELRHDLIDCHVDICSPEVLFLFTDNPDYGDIRHDFVRGTIADDVFGYRIYTHILQGEYAARAKDLRTYIATSRDVLHRWAFPLVPDTNFIQQHSYQYRRGNIYIDKKVKLAISALIGDSTIIGEGTTVGADSTIRNSIIGRNCQIGAEVFIEGAFLWDNVVVADGAHIRHSIVCSSAKVGASAKIEKGCVVSFRVVVGPNVRLEPGTRATAIVPKEFSAYDGKDPTAPLNLGQGGVGRRWNWYSREEAHNPMVADLPVTEWRKGDSEDHDTEPDETEGENEPDAGSEDEDEDEKGAVTGGKAAAASAAAPESGRDRLRREIADTIMGNLEIDPKMFRSLATEARGRLFAQRDLNLEISDVAASVLWCMLGLVVTKAGPSPTPKALVGEITKTFQRWCPLMMNILVGRDGDSPAVPAQIALLNTCKEFIEKDQANVFAKAAIHVIKALYDNDVVTEPAVMQWHEAENATESGKAFQARIADFIAWLKNAEEESEEDE